MGSFSRRRVAKRKSTLSAFANNTFLHYPTRTWTTGEALCGPRRGIGVPNAGKISRPRWNAVFDFVRKVGEEQKQAFEALKSGKLKEYAVEKVKRDLQEVKKVNDGLAKTREKLARDLGSIIGNQAVIELEPILEDLEEVLIMSDLGVDTVDKIIDDLRIYAKKSGLETPADVKVGLKESLARVLTSKDHDLSLATSATAPTIIMVIGANGMGKTTTIGKLATRLRQSDASVLIAACDTFGPRPWSN